jgi:hypothetical protein
MALRRSNLDVEAHAPADPAAQVGGDERDEGGGEEQQQPPPERARLGHDDVVDDDLLYDGYEGGHGLAADSGAEGDGDVAAMGEQVRGEAADPAARGCGGRHDVGAS